MLSHPVLYRIESSPQKRIIATYILNFRGLVLNLYQGEEGRMVNRMLLKNVKIGKTCLLPAANLRQESKYRYICKHGGESRRGA